MKYLEFTFTLSPGSEMAGDVLVALLADAGFDSFVRPEVETDPIKAYVPKDRYDEQTLADTLANFPLNDITVSYTSSEAEDKDWNEVWEKNFFSPLVVDGRCVVHCTFHKDVPKAEYDITIDPRMSFGTGHHATTSQMISEILAHDMTGKTVLDMGCGTSILAILARMRGAAAVTAIDNDEWCVTNSLENIAMNHLDGIDVELGDAQALATKGPFDYILANINRNILLEDMHLYVPRMKPGASLFMSGFYVEDTGLIRAEAERLGLHFDHVRDLNRWACVEFRLD